MRKKIFGTIAALMAGAGGAFAQSPTRPVAPAPIGLAGGFNSGLADPQVRPVNGYNTPIPPPMPGMMGPEAGMMGPGGPGMGDPSGAPGYPPPGVMGQQGYEEPVIERAFNGAHPARFLLEGQYLLLFPESQPVSYPLLTTSGPADLGRLGSPTTTILAGNRNGLPYNATSGFRINASWWRPTDQRVGVEVGGLYVSPTSNNNFLRSSDGGIPLIARPFTNSITNVQQSLIVSSPAAVAGSVLSRATTQFYGIEANALLNLYRTCPGECRMWQLNALLGYRYWELNERLDLSSRSTILAGTFPYGGTTVTAPTTLEVKDSFQTLNRFHGVQVGLQSQFTSGRWFAGATGKVAFGVMSERVTLEGSTGAINPVAGTNSTTLGGLYANAANIGTYRSDPFAVATDLNATLGYHFTSWLVGTVGYNFIHLSAAARPGNLFDGRVNPNLIPASGSYATGVTGGTGLTIRNDDFFIHGLNFGFILKY